MATTCGLCNTGLLAGSSYRDMEDWLWTRDKICAVLNIKVIPDRSTLCRAFQKIGIEVLRSMQKSLLG